MSMDWDPSEKKNEIQIRHSYEFIHEEIERLQNKLQCSDEFIYDFLEAIRDHYSPTSCFAKLRKHKRSKQIST